MLTNILRHSYTVAKEYELKKNIKSSIVLTVSFLLIVSCSTVDRDSAKIGMISNVGKTGYNLKTWEGIQRAEGELDIVGNSTEPAKWEESLYLEEIANLYDTGSRFFIAPGFEFHTTIFKAQNKYSDAKFVIIDGYPHSGNWVPEMNENTVSISFAEHEAGFFAGVATALELSEGEVGFIGGMEIAPVQKYNWGFQQGIAYANEKLKTNITLKAENVIYQGTFTDIDAGQKLAAQMFDKGISAIFCDAVDVGIGAINEAKKRVENGEKVWIVGVDVDQYSDGIYKDNESVILTSAIKKIDNVTYSIIERNLKGDFDGGNFALFTAKDYGVGIPMENPNLSEAVVAKVEEIYELVRNDSIIVNDTRGDLFR